MPTFTPENCTYRNGDKPVAIYYIKESAGQKVFSVSPNGEVRSHWEDGVYHLTREACTLDLIASPPPPRPWSCPGDVPEEAEWFVFDGIAGAGRLTRVGIDRIVVNGSGYTFNDIKNLSGRWSATRTGEYVACTTTNPLTT
jgi:hypothetical protein